jgi:hypothetical protein
MSKVFITVEGESGTLETTALITWALLKLGIRPSYEGDNKNEWQWLASDEFELEKKVRAIAGSQFLLKEVFVKVEQIAPLKTPDELKQELPHVTNIIDTMAKKGQE